MSERPPALFSLPPGRGRGRALPADRQAAGPARHPSGPAEQAGAASPRFPRQARRPCRSVTRAPRPGPAPRPLPLLGPAQTRPSRPCPTDGPDPSTCRQTSAGVPRRWGHRRPGRARPGCEGAWLSLRRGPPRADRRRPQSLPARALRAPPAARTCWEPLSQRPPLGPPSPPPTSERSGRGGLGTANGPAPTGPPPFPHGPPHVFLSLLAGAAVAHLVPPPPCGHWPSAMPILSFPSVIGLSIRCSPASPTQKPFSDWAFPLCLATIGCGSCQPRRWRTESFSALFFYPAS